MITTSALTVTQINTYIKSLIEGDMRLRHITVVGEISNFTRHFRSGHLYLSLKDESCSLKCVMFAQTASRLRFQPENGMRVYVSGRLSVYDRDGVYQLIADAMEPVGAGAMAAALEQLRQKLAAEGLFDADRKKQLPAFPKRIGVVTSASGAAVRDIENVLSRRYPLATMVLCPAAVQGADCAPQNVQALEAIARYGDVDVILLGRGGGSQQDLWGYNDERLVRAVAACPIPIVTGIGHEIDTSLCDLAADFRAPTPSAAAELATPDIRDLAQAVDQAAARAYQEIFSIHGGACEALQNLDACLASLSPMRVLSVRMETLDRMRAQLISAGRIAMERRTTALTHMGVRLKNADPTALLKQGKLTVLFGKEKLKSASQVKAGDQLQVLLADGRLDCTVDAVQQR